MWPRGPVLWLGMGPFEEQLFCESSLENSQTARDRMLRDERIRMPGSKEANVSQILSYSVCGCFSLRWGT